MPTLLHIDSSIYSVDGESSRLARAFVEDWRARTPGARIIERDLALEPVPHLDADTFRAFITPASRRTEGQRAAVAYSDELIAELEHADVIALGLPLYNYGVPSTLKAYFDHVARAGVTFRYTESGPVGLLNGKSAYVFATRGGIYDGSALDTQSAYIRNFLGLLGIEDVRFTYAEGLALGEAAKRSALIRAHETVRALNAFDRRAA